MYQIAIDGPSGAGKSTLAKRLAAQLGFIYVDTGALYRSIGLYMEMNEIDPKNSEAVMAALPNIELSLEYHDGSQVVLLNGENVGDRIRTPQISMYASAVSAIPAVRTFLLDTQRNIAAKNNVIMDGRDIGTVILPNADVKIFLISSFETRARRRVKELLEKGMEASYEDVLADMIERDKNDSSRALAPCKPAEDAIMLDNSRMNLEENIEKVLEIINEKINVAV